MLKDIPFKKVEGVKIAVVPEENYLGFTLWYAYLLNYKDKPITNVLIRSRAFGEIDGEDKKTSVLRHFFLSIPSASYAKIELIDETVLDLNNEFWLSFRHEGIVFDKKYYFNSGEVNEENVTYIDLMEQYGVVSE